MLQANILHPLATLQWEECPRLPDCVDYACCVLWNNKVCIGGGYVGSAQPAQLFMSSTTLDSWEAYATPTEFYALTTYHSDLVLVGGRENGTTNNLWSSSTGRSWFRSLPPMPTKRCWCTAVNTRIPEYLIVAGGRGEDDSDELNVVEVLSENQWSVIQPLPKKCWRMESVLHDGRVYFMGGEGQGHDVYSYDTNFLSNSLTCCNRFRALQKYYYPASFGQQLIAMEFGSSIRAHSFPTQSWVWIGDAPCVELGAPPIVLPTGQLLIIEHNLHISVYSRIFKASLQGKTQLFSREFYISI